MPIQKQFVFVFCLFSSFMSSYSENQNSDRSKVKKSSFITYKLSGRFGDNLLIYCKAKWISYKYGIPLLYKPFKYSNQLMLDKIEQKYNGSLGQTVLIQDEVTIKLAPQAGKLYEIGFHFKPSDWDHDEVLISDERFLKEIRRLISPKKKLTELVLPKDRITVAVHVRRGGGYDQSVVVHTMPLKFPPDIYYIDQIKNISVLCGDQPLYVYIFTDDANPRVIMEKLKKTVDKQNIIFACRQGLNSHNTHVLEDLFNMIQFDCLIRPGSSYSMSAQILGAYKTVIFPKHDTWINKLAVIDEIGAIYNGNINYYNI